MRPKNLDLNQLRTLVTVADLGTVTRAADRLAYTQ
jgi:DNA-binding transcriptional LysR family regulator